MNAELPRRERLAFAAGDTGFNFVWQTIELYLLFYYVRILGLTPGQAAGIFLAGAAVDLVGDPLIGALVDRLRQRVSARAWMLIAGPPLGLALGLAFLAPPFAGPGAIGFLAITHVMMRLCYSLGNIPYATLTSRITDSPAEQMRLTATRMQGAAFGGLVAAAVYNLVPLSHQWNGVPVGAIMLGLAAQPFFLITWAGVRERTSPARLPTDGDGQLAGFGRLLKGSSVLRRLLLLIFFAGLSTTTLHKGLLFVFDRLGAQQWGYAATLVPPLALFAGAPLWSQLAWRLGRVNVMRLTAALHLAAVLAGWFVGSPPLTLAALVSLAIFASAGLSTMFWSLVPGVIDSCERDLATEGCAARVYGAANLARKLGQAVAPLALALPLTLANGNVLAAMASAAAVAMAATIALAPRKGELRRVRTTPAE